MNQPARVIADDDLDLRIYLKRITPQWPFLLFISLASAVITAAVNLLLPPVYEATAVLTIPAYATNDAYAANLLLSDGIYQAVLAKQGVGADILDRVKIKADNRDEATYRITVQAPTASQAALEANAWAEESIKWVKQRLISVDRAWMNKTKSDLESAESDLLQFLDSHGLNAYSILELRYYEGMYAPDVFPASAGEGPLALHSAVRLELRKLLRAQSNAASAYADALDRYQKHQLALQTDSPGIVNRAETTEEPIRPQILPVAKSSLIALVLGFLAGIILILFRAWWKNPTAPPAP
jgi:capsular polysaccharide biosynthesis protein